MKPTSAYFDRLTEAQRIHTNITIDEMSGEEARETLRIIANSKTAVVLAAINRHPSMRFWT